MNKEELFEKFQELQKKEFELISNPSEFKKWQEKEFKLFKEKFDIYGDAYWKENNTFMERHLGGIHRKHGRLQNFIKTGKEGTETLINCYIDIGVYAKMELIKQDLEKKD